MNKFEKLTKKLNVQIDTLPIIDSHEHLSPDPDGTWPQFDLCDLIFHNLNADLTSAGMPGVGTHAQTPWPAETTDCSIKWKSIRQYVTNIANMASFKGLLLGLKELHNFPYNMIDDSNWAMLNEQVVAAYQKKDWIDYVLKEKCNMKAAIIDMDTIEMDRDYFFPAIKLDYFMMSGLDPAKRKYIESKHDVKITSFEDFMSCLHSAFEEYVEGGAVAIKSVAAYYRSLFYQEVARAEVEKMFKLSSDRITPDMEKSFQNFVMHEICSLTEKKGLPIQFHTGKLAWNFRNIEDTKPTHLINLLQKYRQLRFDLFHGGYPYTGEFGIIANTFPNAYLDINGLSWTSLEVTKRCLSEWIEMVPQNKILWGADSYRVLEGVLGQLLYFKKILSEVLAQKVYDGYFDENFALEIAEKILFKNALNFFSLQERIEI
jgi:predicted TIM-barrel fold metal-dependent hydrolase